MEKDRMHPLPPGPPHTGSRHGERGAVLLIWLAFFLVAGLGWIIDALLLESDQARAERRTARSMARASQALIAWGIVAASEPGRPGTLPCPLSERAGDYRQTGDAPAACPNPGQDATGLLPWRTLRLPPLFDGQQTPIGYTLVAAFRPDNQAEPGTDCARHPVAARLHAATRPHAPPLEIHCDALRARP